MFGPDGRYYSGYGDAGRSLPSHLVSTAQEKRFFLTGSFPFLGVSASDPTVISIWPQASVLRVRARTRSPCSTTEELCAHPGSSTTPSPAPSISSSLRTATSLSAASGPSEQGMRLPASANTTIPPGRWPACLRLTLTTGFARPRGLRFGSDGRLFCVGRDHVIAFDFFTGTYLGVAVQLPRLNGQALVLWDGEN